MTPGLQTIRAIDCRMPDTHINFSNDRNAAKRVGAVQRTDNYSVHFTETVFGKRSPRLLVLRISPGHV